MITKDFHSTKDIRLIRGKSFVIMGNVTAPRGNSARNPPRLGERLDYPGRPVPVYRPRPGEGPDLGYLPFEGDLTLSVIVSKAMLLARDENITDPAILRQL